MGYNCDLSGWTRAVVEENEKRRQEELRIDYEIKLQEQEYKKKMEEEHQRRLAEDPSYRRRYECMIRASILKKEEDLKKREEEAKKREKKKNGQLLQEEKRRRFDDLTRYHIADNSEKGLISGGVKEACSICREYLKHGKDADVTKEDFDEAVRKVIAYAYQNCSDDTEVEQYQCDENCKNRENFGGFCKGALLYTSDSGKKCPYARY